MQLTVTQLPDAQPRPRRIAIGTFDGVHIGHQAVIEGADTVLTFEPHPLTVIHPEAAPKLIMPFEVECSSGTYVRQLVAALGDAYCEELERVAVGPFKLADADPQRVVPVAEALSFLPAQELDAAQAARVAHGVRVSAAADAVAGAVRLVHGEELVAIAEPRGRELQPVVVFAA